MHMLLFQVYEAKVKPSNRLLIMVVIVALIMAATVAAVAVGMNWSYSTQSKVQGLSKEVTLMRNAAEFFALNQTRLRTVAVFFFLSGEFPPPPPVASLGCVVETVLLP